MLQQSNIEVEYRRPISNGHMLKVKFNELGMYIDGWRVTRSDKSPSGWWVQSPARQYNGKYINTVEFAKQSEFWKALELECIAVVEAATGPHDTVDVATAIGAAYDEIMEAKDD